MHCQFLPGPQPLVPPSQKDLLHIIGRSLDADVVGVQEVDFNQERSGGHSQVEVIAEEMGAPYWAYARTVIGTPGSIWRKLQPNEPNIQTNDEDSGEKLNHDTFIQDPSYGIGLISRVKVINWHTLSLGKSPIGLPLAFPADAAKGQKGVRLIYVKDEPRIALAAQLENGFTVAVTHLSFVPFVNFYQLRKVQRWLAKLPGKHILLGDLNLPFNLPSRFSNWKSLSIQKTYPSWDPKVQFDYILSDSLTASEVTQVNPPEKFSADQPNLLISDHRSLSINIQA
jgi:endonuclease/exonuclease/phosphatase family metal-dependent hydrolase